MCFHSHTDREARLRVRLFLAAEDEAEQPSEISALLGWYCRAEFAPGEETLLHSTENTFTGEKPELVSLPSF